MRRKRFNLIVTLSVLVALVAGLGWMIYTPVRQERVNRALIAAIKKNDTKTALALLNEGADPNARDMPPQHLSLWRLLLDRLRGKQPAPSQAPTALMLACAWRENDASSKPASDNWQLVKAFLERGAQVNVMDKETGETPLLQAAVLNKTKVCQLLIERGAKVNVTDNNGGTPLIWAIGNKTLVRLLINKGANVRADSNAQAVLDAQDPHGDDPAITELLLSRGAPVDATEPYQHYTALDAAIIYGKVRSVRLLIHHGADVNHKASDGETPLKLAKEWQHPMIVQILKQAGAKE